MNKTTIYFDRSRNAWKVAFHRPIHIVWDDDFTTPHDAMREIKRWAPHIGRGNVRIYDHRTKEWIGFVWTMRNALDPRQRKRPCRHEHAPYTGSMPCTGPRICTMCGKAVQEQSHTSSL